MIDFVGYYEFKYLENGLIKIYLTDSPLKSVTGILISGDFDPVINGLGEIEYVQASNITIDTIHSFELLDNKEGG